MPATIERRHDLETAVNEFSEAPDDDTDDDTEDDDGETEATVRRGPGRPPGSGSAAGKSREQRAHEWYDRMLAKRRDALDAMLKRYKDALDAKLSLKLDAIALAAGGRASNPAAIRASLARQVARHEERLRILQQQLAEAEAEATKDATE